MYNSNPSFFLIPLFHFDIYIFLFQTSSYPITQLPYILHRVHNYSSFAFEKSRSFRGIRGIQLQSMSTITIIYLCLLLRIVASITSTSTGGSNTCKQCSPQQLDTLLAMPNHTTEQANKQKVFALSLAKLCNRNLEIPISYKIQIGAELANNNMYVAAHEMFHSMYRRESEMTVTEHNEIGARCAMVAKQIGKYQQCIDIMVPMLLQDQDQKLIYSALTFGLLAACQHRLNQTEKAHNTHVVAVSHGVYPSFDPTRPGGGQTKWMSLSSHAIWNSNLLRQTSQGKGILQLMNSLEDAKDAIRNEMNQYQLIDTDVHVDQWRNEGQNLINRKHAWKELYIYENGQFNGGLCKEIFPITCNLLRSAIFDLHPQGHVKFSKIYPNSYVYPHSGGSNSKLRGHLGVTVSENARQFAKMTIAGRKIGWKEGKVFLFDDTYEHSVEYTGTGNEKGDGRIVLIFDVFHPDVKRSDRKKMRRLNTKK